MKVVVQRVLEASVIVNNKIYNSIDQGFVLLVGVEKGDLKQDAEYLAQKINGLRVFSDDSGKMNKNIHQVDGKILSISQFTLLGDTRKGFRPNFDTAEKYELAQELYQYFNECLRKNNLTVNTGKFGADMKVELINDGPTTILMDSKLKS